MARTPQADDVEVTLVISRQNLPALREGVSTSLVRLVELDDGRFALRGVFPTARSPLPNPVDCRNLDEVDDLFLGGAEPTEQGEA